MAWTSWKASFGISLALFAVSFSAHAANSTTVQFTGFSIYQTGVKSRTLSAADMADKGWTLSCNQNLAIYGYSCDASTGVTFTVQLINATKPNLTIGVKSSAASSLTNITSTVYPSGSTTPGANATITISTTWDKLLGGITPPATTGTAADVVFTLYVLMATNAGETNPDASGVEKAYIQFTMDAAYPTEGTSPEPETSVYAEAADGKIIVDSFSRGTTAPFQFYVKLAANNDTTDLSDNFDITTAGDTAFSSTAVGAGTSTVAYAIVTNSDGSTSIEGLTNETGYYLAYAVADTATNVKKFGDAAPYGFRRFERKFVPNKVEGALSDDLSCVSGRVGGPPTRGGKELLFWIAVMILGALWARRRPRFLLRPAHALSAVMFAVALLPSVSWAFKDKNYMAEKKQVPVSVIDAEIYEARPPSMRLFLLPVELFSPGTFPLPTARLEPPLKMCTVLNPFF